MTTIIYITVVHNDITIRLIVVNDCYNYIDYYNMTSVVAKHC